MSYGKERFPGVTWNCDNCNSCLSTQRGFDDKLHTWICNKCGYENSISSDAIYESLDDYYASQNEQSYEDGYYEDDYDDYDEETNVTSVLDTANDLLNLVNDISEIYVSLRNARRKKKEGK